MASLMVSLALSAASAPNLMASSALPFIFPAVKIHREYFGDGSMRQVAPISPALHLGAERVLVLTHLNVGYHDDSFAVGTLPGTGWHFMDQLTQTGATETWLTQPVGGELRPEIQHCIFDMPMRCPVIESGADNDFAASAKATHASWLVNHTC